MKTLAVLVLCSALSAMAQITMNDGTALRFGDAVADVAKQLNEKPSAVERGRAGVDELIAVVPALLVFDTGRLQRVTLKRDYLFPEPLRPFAEEWKNFTPIDDRKLAFQMRREDFAAYIEVWKKRAAAAGKQPNVDYWIRETGSVATGQKVSFAFTPRRRLMGTGELIGDTAVFDFTSEMEQKYNPRVRPGVLSEVILTGDEFSTRGREPEGGAPRPAPRINGQPLAGSDARGKTLTFDDGRQVTFGQPLAEVEKTLGRTAQVPSPFELWGPERVVLVPPVMLEFDRERLRSAQFLLGYAFRHPVRAFDETWKNPDPIGEHTFKRGLTWTEFREYLEAWKNRAAAAGKKEGVDYWIEEGRVDVAGLVRVSLAPKRLTADIHGFRTDEWMAVFVGPRGEKELVLNSLQVLVDAFSTQGRPFPGSPDPALTGVTLEDGTQLYFGQAKTEVEQVLGTTAMNTGMPGRVSARADIEQRLALRNFTIYFDTDRLARISYGRFEEPPAPFPELWKNFTPVGELQIENGMTREKFAAYLEAWEARLKQQRILRDKHYTVRDGPASDAIQSIEIRLPASRVSVGGARWPDLWRVSFTLVGAAPNRVWKLSTIEATRGEFNSRPLSAAAQRKKDARAMARDVPTIELPAIEVPRPEIVVPKF